jgi:hypothetical protein
VISGAQRLQTLIAEIVLFRPAPKKIKHPTHKQALDALKSSVKFCQTPPVSSPA